jgi:hypothetical protein
MARRRGRRIHVPAEMSAGTPRVTPGDATDRNILEIDAGNTDITFARTVMKSGDICHAQIHKCRLQAGVGGEHLGRVEEERRALPGVDSALLGCRLGTGDEVGCRGAEYEAEEVEDGTGEVNEVGLWRRLSVPDKGWEMGRGSTHR